jgi:hypothetical protein
MFIAVNGAGKVEIHKYLFLDNLSFDVSLLLLLNILILSSILAVLSKLDKA